MRGKLIALEGIDGSGKATQQDLLGKKLEADGKSVFFTKCPRYDSFYGKLLSRYLNGEFGSIDEVNPYILSLVYAMDRLGVKKDVDNALDNGKIVVANRYVYSSAGFMAGKVNDEDERKKYQEWLFDMEFKENKLAKPDIVVLFDTDPKIGQELVQKKDKSDHSSEKLDMHEADLEYEERVRKIYLELAAKNNWIVVDCVKDGKMMSEEEISAIVWDKVKGLV